MAAKMERTSVPGVYRRGSRYVFTYRYRGRQHWRSAATLAEARRLKHEFEADVARGEHRELGRLTFGDYAREWIECYQGRTNRGFRESTRRGYRQALEDRAIPFFDRIRPLRLAQIEPRDVKAYVMWLCDEKAQGKRLADRTVRTNLAPVQALLATAVEEGILRTNPAFGVRIARRDRMSHVARDERELRKALSREELARLLAAIDEHWRPFFELLAHTGLRIGEAVELRWSDIDFGATPTLHVRRQFFQGEVSAPKTRHGVRAIPLSTGMARALWQRQGAPDDLVFTTRHGKRVQRDNLWRRVLKPAAREAGVEWVGFHTFRHTCASLLFGAGKNVKQVQEWLGHHDPGFTLRTYVHLVDGGLGDADFLDELVGHTPSLEHEDDGGHAAAELHARVL